MGFAEAVKTCLTKYADFKGRARRSEYWYFYLALVIVDIVVRVIGVSALSLLFSLAVLVPIIAAGVRRMHDTGKSGWFLLIPIYNIVLAATDSTPGDNQYGPNPKGANGLPPAPAGYGIPPVA